MSNADLFYVKLPDGDVHRVSLEQLDDAFQAGHIDGTTMVLADGSDKWTTLGALAGIDDDQEEEDGVEPVQVIPQNEPRMPAPAAFSAEPQYVPQQPPRQVQPQRTPWQSPQHTQPLARPQFAEDEEEEAPQYVPQLPSLQFTSLQPPQARVVPSELTRWQASPLAAQALAPQNQPPSVRTPYGQTVSMPAPRSPVQGINPHSVRPVSVDLGQFDPDAKRARRGSGRRWLIALAGLSLVGAAGGIATVRPHWARPYLNRIGLAAPSVAVAAAEPPPAPVEAPPPPVTAAAPPAPPQVVAAPAASGQVAADSPLNPHFTDRFTPEQKEKLAEADRARPKSRAKAAAPSHGTAKPKSSGFTTGGNKYDPLNSSI